MRTVRLFAVAAVAALLTACGGGNPGNSAPPFPARPQSSDRELTTLSTFVAQNADTGELVRIYPTRDVMDAARATEARNASTSSNLTYHGGPVQTAPHIYVVYWGSSWNGSGDPNGVRARYNAFISIVGGSKWLNSVTQYTQSNGQHVGNSAGSFIGSYVDTTTSVPSRPSQSALAAEAARAAAHYGDYSTNASYVVALPHGVRPSGFGTQYCAWHSSTSVSGKGIIGYTNLPYMPDAGASCGASSVNAGSAGTLDGVSIVGGHEQGETETDPQPNTGWLDASGAENGDKCAWTGLENNPNAGGYPTQPLWSNATGSCVQSY
ncbi:MAG TPA: hypothetical protein VHS78_17220 [Candidatus Elarobacter sp.]|nr:hypothetical protein [Candidatus Elarobacter sp.]